MGLRQNLNMSKPHTLGKFNAKSKLCGLGLFQENSFGGQKWGSVTDRLWLALISTVKRVTNTQPPHISAIDKGGETVCMPSTSTSTHMGEEQGIHRVTHL